MSACSHAGGMVNPFIRGANGGGVRRGVPVRGQRPLPPVGKLRMPLPPAISSCEIHPGPLRRQPDIPGLRKFADK